MIKMTAADLRQPLGCNHKCWICMESLFNWKHFLRANRTVALDVDSIQRSFEIRSSRSFQISKLLPDGNLTLVFSLGNTLNCFRYWAQKEALVSATCSVYRDYLGSTFIFGLFLKFWMQTEEYIFKE